MFGVDYNFMASKKNIRTGKVEPIELVEGSTEFLGHKAGYLRGRVTAATAGTRRNGTRFVMHSALSLVDSEGVRVRIAFTPNLSGDIDFWKSVDGATPAERRHFLTKVVEAAKANPPKESVLLTNMGIDISELTVDNLGSTWAALVQDDPDTQPQELRNLRGPQGIAYDLCGQRDEANELVPDPDKVEGDGKLSYLLNDPELTVEVMAYLELNRGEAVTKIEKQMCERVLAELGVNDIMELFEEAAVEAGFESGTAYLEAQQARRNTTRNERAERQAQAPRRGFETAAKLSDM